MEQIKADVNSLLTIVNRLDDQKIEDLVKAGTSSRLLKDIGEILLDLGECIDRYRDKEFYKDRRIRRIK